MADQRVELWDAINDYGDPGSHVHGNTSRQDAVVRIEEIWNRRAPDPRLAEMTELAVSRGHAVDLLRRLLDQALCDIESLRSADHQRAELRLRQALDTAEAELSRRVDPERLRWALHPEAIPVDPRIAAVVRTACAVRDWLHGAGPIGTKEDADLIQSVDWLRESPDLLSACGVEVERG